ncbi:MAG: DJ-1/PfpI family protein [Symploca sp. SIO2E6]|nr:DJ-1/PfpI family protein [Symploca sp. SIO2E6]
MPDQKVRTVAALVFNDAEPLDLFGPINAFKAACLKDESKLYQAFTIGETKGTVKIWDIDVVVEYDFADPSTPNFDILLIPGGKGTRILVDNKQFIQGLKQLCGKAKIIACVCTGSALLAKTGLLDGKEATSNKKAWEWVIKQGSEVNWNCPKRWVDGINHQEGIITSAGVSAGIDMSIALIEKLNGEDVATRVQEHMEYNWNRDPDKDPFANMCPGCSPQ